MKVEVRGIEVEIGEKGIGEIILNWGSMFSGKTEELIRQIRRSRIAGQKVRIYKPRIDNRYSESEVVTHYGDRYTCKVIDDAWDILKDDLEKIDVVGIDEGQFLGKDLIDVCKILKYKGIKVIVSGLDMWSTGEPVENMALLAAIANEVNKFHAVCVKTGKEAYISHSLVKKDGNIKVGGEESYIAVSEEVHLRLLEEERNREKEVKEDGRNSI